MVVAGAAPFSPSLHFVLNKKTVEHTHMKNIALIVAVISLIVAAAALLLPRVKNARDAVVFYTSPKTAEVLPNGNLETRLVRRGGVYELALSVNGSGRTVYAVVDTGSAHLLLGTRRCIECLSGGGGVIENDSAFDMTQSIVKMKFGTQTDDVLWTNTEVCFGKSSSTCPNVSVGGVVARRGTSNLNVAGLSVTSPSPRSLVHQLGLRFVRIDLRGKRLVIGDSNPIPPSRRSSARVMGIVHASTCSGSDVTTDVDGVVLNGVTLPGVKKVCWDTGSNVCSLPDTEEMRDAVQRARGKRRGELEIMRVGSVGLQPRRDEDVSDTRRLYDTADDVVRTPAPPMSSLIFHDVQDCPPDLNLIVVGTPVLQRFALTMNAVTGLLTID